MCATREIFGNVHKGLSFLFSIPPAHTQPCLWNMNGWFFFARVKKDHDVRWLWFSLKLQKPFYTEMWKLSCYYLYCTTDIVMKSVILKPNWCWWGGHHYKWQQWPFSQQSIDHQRWVLSSFSILFFAPDIVKLKCQLSIYSTFCASSLYV